MAKQKTKLPVKRAGAPALAKAVPGKGSAKRKAKSTGKAKAKVGARPAGEAILEGPAGAERKPKGVGGVAKDASVAAPPVEGLAMHLPATAPVRSRKLRPGAPLGRLERLELAIGEVRVGGRASLRTRKLLAAGIPKMAQKVIEEAAEAAIEAIRGDHAAFVNETVDLFYNLLALSSEVGVPLAAIWAEMDRREQTLGMAEKLPKTSDL